MSAAASQASPVSAAPEFLCSDPVPGTMHATGVDPTSAAPVVALADSGLEVDAELGFLVLGLERTPDPAVDLSVGAFIAWSLLF